MIEHVAVPTPKELKRLREQTPPETVSRWDGGTNVSTPNPAHITHMERLSELESAQAKLDSLKADGWEVIGTSSFIEGEGVNFMLYKADAPAQSERVRVTDSTPIRDEIVSKASRSRKGMPKP